MPNFKGHLTGGIATYLFILMLASQLTLRIYTNYSEMFLWLGLCLLGALFPDIDIRSKGQKIFYAILLLVLVWSIAYQQWSVLSVASIVSVIPLISRHRGISHNLWFILIIPMIIPITISYKGFQLTKASLFAYIFFVAGAISHLVLDFGLVRFWRRSFPKSYRYRRWR